MNRKEKEQLLRQQLAAVAAFACGSSCVPAAEMEEIIQSSTEIVLRKSGMRREGRMVKNLRKDDFLPLSSELPKTEKPAQDLKASASPSKVSRAPKVAQPNRKLLRRLEIIAQRQAAASKDLSGEPQVHWVGRDGCELCGRGYGSVHLSSCQAINLAAEVAVIS